MLVDGGGCLKGPKRVFGSIGPEGVLWDMSHRQVVEPLATCLSAWGQTRKIKENFILGSVCYFTSIKSICSLAFFKKKLTMPVLYWMKCIKLKVRFWLKGAVLLCIIKPAFTLKCFIHLIAKSLSLILTVKYTFFHLFTHT